MCLCRLYLLFVDLMLTFIITTCTYVLGYREKVFAIIGVKVYAAAFYVGSSVTESLHSWNGKSAADILEASSVFTFLYQGID